MNENCIKLQKYGVLRFRTFINTPRTIIGNLTEILSKRIRFGNLSMTVSMVTKMRSEVRSHIKILKMCIAGHKQRYKIMVYRFTLYVSPPTITQLVVDLFGILLKDLLLCYIR